jgi:hypothetical protein
MRWAVDEIKQQRPAIDWIGKSSCVCSTFFDEAVQHRGVNR